jgi:hypothetical protein
MRNDLVTCQCRLLFWTGLILVGLSPSAHALVFFGDIPPGTVELGYGWPIEPELKLLVERQRHVAGHFTDAPTWWDGHFTAEYFYQGREAAPQRLIDDLDRLIYPHVKVIVAEAEGMWDGNRLAGHNHAVAYDWSLTLSETRMRNPAQYNHNGKSVINEPIVVLRIYLGDRLDRSRLRIPRGLLETPNLPGGHQVINTDGPVDALHALARAARRD